MNHSDPDLVRRAAATLRTERTGHNAGSGFTRARILNDLRGQRKKRRRWWRIGFPIGIILAGTTAWASASGTLPAVWVTVSTFLTLPLTDNGVSERSLPVPGKLQGADRLRSPVAGDQETAHVPAVERPVEPPAIAPTVAEPFSPPAIAHTPPASESRNWNDGPKAKRQRSPVPSGVSPGLRETNNEATHQRATSADLDAPPTETSGRPRTTAPPPPELEAEVRAFREADDLYRHRGDLEAAIGAYRRYVRDYPTGRFVPEAKYNAALALMKLGRAAEARPLLAPFAAGVYGTYRQTSAQQLLDALDD